MNSFKKEGEKIYLILENAGIKEVSKELYNEKLKKSGKNFWEYENDIMKFLDLDMGQAKPLIRKYVIEKGYRVWTLRDILYMLFVGFMSIVLVISIWSNISLKQDIKNNSLTNIRLQKTIDNLVKENKDRILKIEKDVKKVDTKIDIIIQKTNGYKELDEYISNLKKRKTKTKK